MQMAFKEALKGMGRTHPNPAVGAVIVRGGKVVGKGWHHGPGRPHAEINALREAGELARGADLYVTLEPCNTVGRTPPCTEALVSSGIARVWAATADPNPAVRGGGAEELRKAGLVVTLGFLEEEGRRVDEAYHHFYSLGRPFVHLKIAESLDGRVVNSGNGRYITGEEARQIVHEERFLSDAILVSAGTVVADDPLLTVRHGREKKALLRVILDSGSILNGSERIFTTCPEGGNVLIIGPEGGVSKLDKMNGVEIHRLPVLKRGGFDLDGVLRLLRERQVVSLYVEAVGRLAGSFLRERLVDAISIHFGSVILGGDRGIAAVEGRITKDGSGVALAEPKWRRAGDDMIFSARVEGRCFRD